MIAVNDPYNLVPELFLVYPEFVKDSTAAVDILPPTAPESFETSDRVTVFIQPEPDMHRAHEVFSKQLSQRPNSVFAVSGISVSNNWQVPYVLYFSNLTMTVRVNPNIEKLSIGPKKYIANVLLGGQSMNRDRMFSQFQSLNLLERCLANYHHRTAVVYGKGQFNQPTFQSYRSAELDKFDNQIFLDVAFDKESKTASTCRPIPGSKPFSHAWVSQIIPYQIYNRSYLCVVAETEASADGFFISEKISKPLILAQPFVVFGGTGFLKHLRNLGFQTFSPWIDESYDDIENNLQRVDAIVNAVKQFADLTTDQQLEILDKIKPATEHNRRLVLDYRWTMGPLVDEIKSRLNLKESQELGYFGHGC